MKAFGAVAALFLFCTTASFAQISVQGEDGSTITIGPGGINMNDRSSGSKSHVRMGAGGIQIDSANGGNRSRVNLGPGINVQTNRGVGTQVTTTTKRGGTNTVKTTTVSQTAGGAGQQVSLIEMKIYGKTFPAMPLMARVEKLEVDNLGKKGAGPLKTRISILAKELGVNLASNTTTTSTTIVNPGNTIHINSGRPEGASVSVNDGASRGSIVANELNDLVINENNQIIKGHCNGNDIVINGNHCQLHLSGKLGSVTINGNHNIVKSERIEEVVTNGNFNAVSWARGQATPDIANNGKDNVIHQQ